MKPPTPDEAPAFPEPVHDRPPACAWCGEPFRWFVETDIANLVGWVHYCEAVTRPVFVPARPGSVPPAS